MAAVIGGLGGAAIYAATEGSAHTMGGGTHGVGGRCTAPPPHPAAHRRRRPSRARRACYTASTSSPTANGGYTTKLTQTGTVDEVTLSSVVVRSDDGYTQIYAFPSNAGIDPNSVAANDTVTVDATRTGADGDPEQHRRGADRRRIDRGRSGLPEAVGDLGRDLWDRDDVSGVGRRLLDG